MSNPSRTGLDALLTPEESVLVLIDHQPFQFANLNSHEPTMVVNNVVGLAKAAKAFGVPTVLTTVLEERGGLLIQGIQDVFPEQKPIDRTFINTWQDERVVDAVKATGRKKLILAGLWTEICLAMPAIQAAGEGFEVYAVTDASGVCRPRPTTWRYGAWSRRASFRSPGWPCWASGSGTGPARRPCRPPQRPSTAGPRGWPSPGRCSSSPPGAPPDVEANMTTTRHLDRAGADRRREEDTWQSK